MSVGSTDCLITHLGKVQVTAVIWSRFKEEK